MWCPFCQTPLTAHAAECPGCRLTFPRTRDLLGEAPSLTAGIADTTGLLDTTGTDLLRKRIVAIRQRFPQLGLQVLMHAFPSEHPFSMHVFWLFNAANFAGHDKRGKENLSLLVALDPFRNVAAIIPGYGLETSLKTKPLDHLLELAGPSWEKRLWADGLLKVLDGLDQLLESIAVPDDGDHSHGEF